MSSSTEAEMNLHGNLKDIVDEMLKFKCHLCNKYLSVPPIYVSNDGTKYRCGRCKDITFLVSTPNARNCFCGMKFKSMKKFVLTELLCPVYNTCGIEIKSEELIDHMKVHHRGNFKEETMNCKVKKDYFCVMVFVAEGIPFLVRISVEKVFIMPMKPNKLFTYTLTINNSDCSLSYKNQIVNEEYNEIESCFKCLSKTCTKIYHPYSTHYSKENNSLQYTSIDKKVLEAVFGDYSELRFIINISTKKKSLKNKSINDSVSTLKISNMNDIALRKNFECPICMQYMIGPIFSCQTGHSICNDCKSNLKICPMCQSELGYFRNFSLEKLAESLKVYCSHHAEDQEEACNFAGNLKEISLHELVCLKKH